MGGYYAIVRSHVCWEDKSGNKIVGYGGRVYW